MKFKVEISENQWLADGIGYPAITSKKDDARIFRSRFQANLAIKNARKYKLYLGARIQPFPVQEERSVLQRKSQPN